jgi:hypothetical protein
MKFFFLDKLLKFTGRRLDGYKTLIGGIGLILLGVLGLLGVMFPDQGLPQMGIEEALLTLSSGMAVLGLGGKAEKIRAVLGEQKASAADPESGDGG